MHLALRLFCWASWPKLVLYLGIGDWRKSLFLGLRLGLGHDLTAEIVADLCLWHESLF
jgi:hypothetical protein